jgi:hypothetical protein
MERNNTISRWAWLGTTSTLAVARVTGHTPLTAAAPLKTPRLSSEEISAIETAIGKKGTYNDAQAVHTIALPRNDLKIAINSPQP